MDYIKLDTIYFSIVYSGATPNWYKPKFIHTDLVNNIKFHLNYFSSVVYATRKVTALCVCVCGPLAAKNAKKCSAFIYT